jgi:photosystem II stability/assembly factor-like uncharacterized protein
MSMTGTRPTGALVTILLILGIASATALAVRSSSTSCLPLGIHGWITTNPPGVKSASAIATIGCEVRLVAQRRNGSNFMFTSSDTGHSWSASSFPANAISVGAISFPSGREGWAVGQSRMHPLVLATRNGGATWTPQRIPASVRDLSGIMFANAAVGVAVGDGTGPANPPSGVVLVTRNGGRVWTRRPVPADITDLISVTLTSSSVWAVGTTLRGGVLIASHHGGRWIERHLAAGGQLTRVAAVSDHQAWVGGSAPTHRAPLGIGLLLRTTAGGRRWQRVSIPSSQAVRSILIEGQHIWIGARRESKAADRMLESMNGGRTWKRARIPNRPPFYADQLAFTPTAIIWAVGASGVFVTTDGH